MLHFFLNVCLFLRERKRQSVSGGGEERGDRIWNRLQALSCQHRAQCGARTHEPWDHDLSRSRTLNRLSHTGAPVFPIVFKVSFLTFVFYSASVSSHLESLVLVKIFSFMDSCCWCFCDGTRLGNSYATILLMSLFHVLLTLPFKLLSKLPSKLLSKE